MRERHEVVAVGERKQSGWPSSILPIHPSSCQSEFAEKTKVEEMRERREAVVAGERKQSRAALMPIKAHESNRRNENLTIHVRLKVVSLLLSFQLYCVKYSKT
ncbi:hypothetical protein CFP56_033318 [Quercus suber]|uniref:Uncharacterized protein n=1 Tax=Quercus suber TaxID=58331 RepID=A0AAW0MDL3_QUESU